MKSIKTVYATVEYTDWGCETIFWDGAKFPSTPHEIPHYYIISHRCGYGDDIMAYCREHEVFHHLVSEKFMKKPSYVLRTLATGQKQERGLIIAEEMMAQQMQRWVRAHERPILSGYNWDEFKMEALDLLQAS